MAKLHKGAKAPLNTVQGRAEERFARLVEGRDRGEASSRSSARSCPRPRRPRRSGVVREAGQGLREERQGPQGGRREARTSPRRRTPPRSSAARARPATRPTRGSEPRDRPDPRARRPGRRPSRAAGHCGRLTPPTTPVPSDRRHRDIAAQHDASPADLPQGRAVHRERDPGHVDRGPPPRRGEPGAGDARLPGPGGGQGGGLPRDRGRHQPVRDHLGGHRAPPGDRRACRLVPGPARSTPRPRSPSPAAAPRRCWWRLLSLINPGDEVILTQPFYENYWPDCVLAGAEPRFVPLRPPHWRFDLDELAAAFNDRTKAIILCNPNNPTGTVFSRDDLEAIAALCRKWDVIAITDEIYEHIIYDGRPHVALAGLDGMWERSVTIGGMSKTYAVTGWRVGTMLAPPQLTHAFRQVHDFVSIGAAAPLQEAGAVAYRLPRAVLRPARRRLPGPPRPVLPRPDRRRLRARAARGGLLRHGRHRGLRRRPTTSTSPDTWSATSASPPCPARASSATRPWAGRMSASASASATRRSTWPPSGCGSCG